MRATAAAASTQAAASLVRVRIIGLPVGATDGATPGAGARSLQHRVSYYAFTALRLEPEHHQRAAGVRHVRVIAERADRAQRRRRIFGPDAERHTGARSEEHTSELQSRGHLVCRLLLEKKNPHHGR